MKSASARALASTSGSKARDVVDALRAQTMQLGDLGDADGGLVEHPVHARGSVAIRRDLGDEQQFRAHAAHRSRADQRTETGARDRADAGATVRVGERERGDGPRRGRRTRGDALGDELAAHEATHRAGTIRERRVRSFFGRGGAVARGVPDHGQRRTVGPGHARRRRPRCTPTCGVARREDEILEGGRVSRRDRHLRSRRDARDRGRAPAARARVYCSPAPKRGLHSLATQPRAERMPSTV